VEMDWRASVRSEPNAYSQWRLRRWPAGRSSPVHAGLVALEWSEHCVLCALDPRRPRRAERLRLAPAAA
jgi:hypothetical protein